MKPCCTPSRETAGTTPEREALPLGQHVVRDHAEVVKIPSGRALLGTDHPFFPVDGEGPLRKKKMPAFRMDATTVTNAQFRDFVADTGYVTDAERFGDSLVFQGLLPKGTPPSHAVADAPWWRMIQGANWRDLFGPDTADHLMDDHPVVHVSWNDAVAFAGWAGGRLPTEAEWEHAARGGLGDVPFPWGDQEPDDTDFQPCNIWQGRFPHQDLAFDGYTGTAPARSFAPNAYGLYNMVGNVWELTSELFKVRSLKKDVIAAHAGKKGFKLSKGGSFLCHRSYCYRYRIAARNSGSQDTSTSHTGFRLVYDAV
ncbi:formylglycine-generating enzyme required for sulfatase activity [Litoreibacter meonggei]|uniref:Formylglycine-generating enzyme required for sulfatase activity n=1 Tax=Litoreibacter meonggei TaxID=1049199 RepID=A0A497W6L9_9RHOB|nr:formylglycine-generating enzyme required for sulfatase activity [Litoreibacter meonggei]